MAPLAAGALRVLRYALGVVGLPLLGMVGAECGPKATAPPTSPAAAETAATRAAREALLADVERRDPGLSPRTLSALGAVPRHLFVPSATIEEAYANRALPIGHDQTISQPTVVAIMTDALQLRGDESVLEVGTGSGYQAAVLSRLARRVYSIEIVAALADEARARLAALGYANVTVRHGDGYEGWAEHAPFDRILLTAAPPELPPALVAQLREGGVLVAPVGERDQSLYRWTKHAGGLTREYLGAVRFVPMVPSDAAP